MTLDLRDTGLHTEVIKPTSHSLVDTARTYKFYDVHSYSSPELAKQYGLDITEFISVVDGNRRLILPLHYNTEDDNAQTPNPCFIVDGQPQSVAGLHQNIVAHENSRPVEEFQTLEVDDNFLNLFEYGISVLNLPPIVSAYLAQQEGMTTDRLLNEYHPNSPQDFTSVIAVSGPSRAGKSQFLAIEAFKGNIAVVASEPFSDYGFKNYLQVLQDFNNGPNGPITYLGDEALLDIINSGMKQMEDSGKFPPRVIHISDMLEEMSSYFKTGRIRPSTIYFDLNGYTPDHPREPHQYDALTFFACDTLSLLGRGFEAVVDHHWQEVFTDKRALDVNAEVIEDYRRQLTDGQDDLYKLAYASQGRFRQRLEKPHDRFLF